MSLETRLLNNVCKSSKIPKDVLKKETGLPLKTIFYMSGLRTMGLTNGQSAPSLFKEDAANNVESDGLTF